MSGSRTHPGTVHAIARMDEAALVRAAVRERDDAAAAELAARSYDLIALRVRRFRHPQRPDVRIPAADYDDVAQDAWARTVKMLRNLRAPTVGAFRAALRTTVDNTCRDWCRADMTADMKRAGSLQDERVGAGGEPYGALDADVALLSRRAADDAHDALEAADRLERAVRALPDERQRHVVALTAEGYSSREIGERLGESVANVDQLRSRAYRQLRRSLGDDQC
jgi:RNA polymerase sigma factor (sigma-70 family)